MKRKRKLRRPQNTDFMREITKAFSIKSIAWIVRNMKTRPRRRHEKEKKEEISLTLFHEWSLHIQTSLTFNIFNASLPRLGRELHFSARAHIYTDLLAVLFFSLYTYFTHSSPCCCWWCYDFPTFVSPFILSFLFFFLYAMHSDRHDRLRYTLYTWNPCGSLFHFTIATELFLLFLSSCVFFLWKSRSIIIVPKSRSSLLIAIDLNSPVYAEWMLNGRKRFAQRRIEHNFVFRPSQFIILPSFILFCLYKVGSKQSHFVKYKHSRYNWNVHSLSQPKKKRKSGAHWKSESLRSRFYFHFVSHSPHLVHVFSLPFGIWYDDFFHIHVTFSEFEH